MDCQFCYLDFGEKASDLSKWIAIIDRVSEFGFDSITFGGGDPFNYKDFSTLLSYTRRKKPSAFIQVDTNGLGIKEEHYAFLTRESDLVGLPLDGSCEEVHREMRGMANHFDKVIALMRRLSERGAHIKINTVVGSHNIGDLLRLSNLLRPFRPDIWSLYEFWSLGPALSAAAKYRIQRIEYMEAVSAIAQQCDFTHVEIGSVPVRHRSYFFVSHTGRAYTLDKTDPEKYVNIGSVFDDAVVERWRAHGDAERMAERLDDRVRASTGR